MTHIDLYEPASGPLWDESVKATDEMIHLADEPEEVPMNKWDRLWLRITAVFIFAVFICLIVAAHSFGQWLGVWK